MLPVKLRLKYPDFQRNPNPARKIPGENYLFYIKQGNPGGMRFNISTPKSLDKRAVVRNRTRRLTEQMILAMKEHMRDGRKEVLVRARKIITRQNRERCERELRRVLIDETANT